VAAADRRGHLVFAGAALKHLQQRIDIGEQQVAGAGELDSEAVRRARFFTDCRESCLNEAGDFLIPREEGVIDDSHLLGELGDVFLGKVPGRVSHDDVTIFESLGIAIEDLASAHFIQRRAVETGAGTWLEWGGPTAGA